MLCDTSVIGSWNRLCVANDIQLRRNILNLIKLFIIRIYIEKENRAVLNDALYYRRGINLENINLIDLYNNRNITTCVVI